MKKDLRDKINQLRERVEALHLTVKDDLTEMEDVLFDNTHTLPEGCPSRESMAELILRKTEEKLSWVNHAFTELRKRLPQ